MALRSARARGREGCFESPLPTSGLHSPRNELRASRPPNDSEDEVEAQMLVASLNAFCASPILWLRRRFHVSAGRYCQQRGKYQPKAANRRNEKKALSEAASFFRFDFPLGLKGASSPFLVDPARRNRWCFSGSLLARKREQLALMKKRSILRRRRKNHSSVICSPSSSARTSAPVAGRLRTR